MFEGEAKIKEKMMKEEEGLLSGSKTNFCKTFSNRWSNQGSLNEAEGSVQYISLY
jgi:hypothetical protein